MNGYGGSDKLEGSIRKIREDTERAIEVQGS